MRSPSPTPPWGWVGGKETWKGQSKKQGRSQELVSHRLKGENESSRGTSCSEISHQFQKHPLLRSHFSGKGEQHINGGSAVKFPVHSF